MTTNYKQVPIYELKDWLTEESHVQLPAIQRGFVWKVSQIERLWDSIFRGYPIGSMMLSGVGDDLKKCAGIKKYS